VDEAHERLAQQLIARTTERALERGIHTREEAAEIGHAQHVARQRKEAIELLAPTRVAGGRVALYGFVIGRERRQALTSTGTPTGPPVDCSESIGRSSAAVSTAPAATEMGRPARRGP
jgi:hypothetical protein